MLCVSMIICWQTFGEPPLRNQLETDDDDDQKCWPGLGMLRSGGVRVRLTTVIEPIGRCMHACCFVASGPDAVTLAPSPTLHLPTLTQPTQASKQAETFAFEKALIPQLRSFLNRVCRSSLEDPPFSLVASFSCTAQA